MDRRHGTLSSTSKVIAQHPRKVIFSTNAYPEDLPVSGAFPMPQNTLYCSAPSKFSLMTPAKSVSNFPLLPM